MSSSVFHIFDILKIGQIYHNIFVHETFHFHDPEIGTADNKSALETSFFAILSPKKGMGGFVIDI